MEKSFLCENRTVSTKVIIDRSFQKLKEFLHQEFKDAPRLICLDERIPVSFQNEIVSAVSDLAPQYWVWKQEGGEKIKTREAKQALEDWCLAHNVGGDTCVVVLGGGAFLDLIGFFAATYMRGLPLVVAPSTVLAMSDAAFGGKNGVNACGIKNIIGTVWHPCAVCNNLTLLQSLSSKQRADGLVEVVKHALISSNDLAVKTMSLWEASANGDEKALFDAISLSIEVKADILEQSCDEPEIRHLLNLGHTVAHAVEALDTTISHGMSVAIGMWVESVIGSRRGVTSQRVVLFLEELLTKLSCHHVLSKKWSFEEWEHVMQRDKKNISGAPCVVLLQDIGVPYCLHGSYRVLLTKEEIVSAYELVQRFFA